MRIAFFSDSYLPYRSGVVRSIETFTRELRRAGHEVFIFAPSYGASGPEENIYRFPSVRAPNFKEFALAIPWAPRLGKLLTRLQPDVIHVHSPFMVGRLGARAARHLDVPLVFTYHTLYDKYAHYFPLAPGLAAKVVRWYAVNFCNRCNLVIAPTTEVASFLRENGVKARIEALPTGIVVEEYQRGDPGWLRRKTGLGEEDVVLLHVGRLGKEKNLDFLLRCFARLRREAPFTHLVLVGSGPLEGHLREEARRLGVLEAVHFLGAFPFEDMPKVYRGADVFVFASLTETQGLVIAEAKAAGLPVVAVAAYGVKEMVKHGVDGFLVPPDEEEFIAILKEIILNRDLRRRMGTRAAENAYRLSSSAMARRLIDLYRELIDEE
ncbi:glycosyltransferase family 4 protein [Thermanaeromonas sp. C210]|uniref:glycosyltransferase family 4 protein n=1 Tax=Thermanaeromonas sp. C210 TaxID=2731925 RepID=UPI00155D347C|nr:glycosyltransferase family 4 protein [Thermanaeromonas sp. C210]GFN23720.1 1,2-diacylglycerol 3-glucosyltransferase [Thermanaeromonas sp. C210]